MKMTRLRRGAGQSRLSPSSSSRVEGVPEGHGVWSEGRATECVTTPDCVQWCAVRWTVFKRGCGTRRVAAPPAILAQLKEADDSVAGAHSAPRGLLTITAPVVSPAKAGVDIVAASSRAAEIAEIFLKFIGSSSCCSERAGKCRPLVIGI